MVVHFYSDVELDTEIYLSCCGMTDLISQATFRITLDLPSELMALSNMPIIDEKFDGNVKTIYFEESPIMSSYLVAVAVGLFDHIEETTADGMCLSQICFFFIK